MGFFFQHHFPPTFIYTIMSLEKKENVPKGRGRIRTSVKLSNWEFIKFTKEFHKVPTHHVHLLRAQVARHHPLRPGRGRAGRRGAGSGGSGQGQGGRQGGGAGREGGERPGRRRGRRLRHIRIVGARAAARAAVGAGVPADRLDGYM